MTGKQWHILMATVVLALLPVLSLAGEINMYFTPEWREKSTQAKEIAEALAKSSGLPIHPRVVSSNGELITLFAKQEPAIVYVGSMVTAVLTNRELVVPIAQGVTGREMYTSVLIAPATAGDNAEAIVKEAGPAISYAKGTSSGESGAKAASAGQANLGAPNHPSAVNAIKAGKAKAAFVKNWWWDDNKDKFPECKKLDFPGVSDHHNPDNVLSVSKAVSVDETAKIKKAAMENFSLFGVKSFQDFSASSLNETLDLMNKAKLDPKTYTW